MACMRPVLRRLLAGVCLVATCALSGAVAIKAARNTDAVTSESYMKHVRYLSSDELGGRGNGTRELEKAAEYIASQMKAAGLKPGGPGGSWFQPFEISTGLTIGSGNRLTVRTEGQALPLHLGSSYYPLAVTPTQTISPASASLTGVPLVFGGYGISARQIGYDDYASVDVKGKAVLVFTHEPQEQDPQSRFNGAQPSQYATLIEKAMTARNHGAAALLIVADPTHDRDTGTYAAFAKDPQAENYGLPVLRVDRTKVQPLLDAWGLPALAREIDRDLKPRSRGLPATVDYAEHLSRTRRLVRNVIGVLPGRDKVIGHEAVVLGAHYDHLGLGGHHSLSPELAGQIHNGADDNASGTAAVLELARAAAGSRNRFPRTLVFVAFAGEELGLLGSGHYVDNPAIPLDRTVAMINLDMVGRAQGKVVVSGLDASPSLKPDMDQAAALGGIEVKQFQEGAGVGSSDDTSFTLKKVPSIGFFSGFHADYHRPGDDWQKIDADGAVRVVTVALELTARIAGRQQRPEFTATTAPTHGPASTGESSSGGGYGPYFGSVPDFGDSSAGMKIADVRENGPAWKGGLRGGDVMVEFAGAPIKSLVDFTYALRERKPGDVVEVKVVRGGSTLTLTVELTTRP